MRLLRTLIWTLGLALLTQAHAKDVSVSISEKDLGIMMAFEYFDNSRVALYVNSNGKVFRSQDEGGQWKQVKLKHPPALNGAPPIVFHPYDNNVAFIFTDKQDHMITKDQGKSWKTFRLVEGQQFEPKFHASQHDQILVNTVDKKTGANKVFYTTDQFKSNAKQVRNDQLLKCLWAFANKAFESSIDQQTMVCVMGADRTLVTTPDFGSQVQTVKVNDKKVVDIVGIGSESSFITGAFEAAPSQPRLIVTKDAITWSIPSFPDIDSESAFTILPSSKYSLHVDVADKSGRGTLFTSNSLGTSFRECLDDTARSRGGLVDLEHIQNIDGILVANVDVETEGQLAKDRRSKISFDDGRNWEFLRLKGCDSANDDCYVNLHNVLDHRNAGRIFSSPTPGLLAGIGNTGRALDSRMNGDLFVSENSGITWTKALDGPHLYEFGAMGTILVAVPDDVTDSLRLSVDRGRSWQEAKLKTPVQPIILTTNPKSATTDFILIGVDPKKDRTLVITLRLSVFSRVCDAPGSDGGRDFEKWYGRYDPISDKPSCILGHKQIFFRKKIDAECVVDPNTDFETILEHCPCQEEDYECDEGFTWSFSEYKCIPGQKLQEEWSKCTKGSTVERAKGYSLIPGDTCTKDGGLKLDGTEKVTCKGDDDEFHNNPPPEAGDGRITTATKVVDGSVVDYFYLRADPEFKGQETVMMRNEFGELFVSHNQGFDWEQPFPNEEIVALHPNPYFPSVVFALTAELKLKVTTNRGHGFSPIALPARPVAEISFKFHPDHPNMVITEGFENSQVFYTTDAGQRWQELGKPLSRCAWIGSRLKYGHQDDKLIFCERIEQGISKSLVSSSNYFRDETVHLKDIVGFALEEEFIVAAQIDSDAKQLLAFASVDGSTFAEARFPANFKLDHQQEYTLLQSITSSIFMHVTVSNRKGGEYGSILKSNFNGTDYVVSLEYVNRNSQGYADFERIQGLEGIALANVVVNVKDVDSGGHKKIKTVITHNDGARWFYLSPPPMGADGNRYCRAGESNAKCSLNLHAYTEREDYRDTYSSQSAIGLMVAIGNVGEYLTGKDDANTYLTRDGGVTWKEVKKGNYLWEFGDSGSIIALVQNNQPTNILYYTLDEGESWNEYKFSEDQLTVFDIATTPSDTSRKFLLFTKPIQGHKSSVLSVDFTNIFPRRCIVDSGNDVKDDFELWAPWNPKSSSGECLFGHQSLYHRKKLDRNCYIGWDPTNKDILRPHVLLKNCSCTREDFECDYNYFRDSDGVCKLVPGFSPPNHANACKENPKLVEFWEPTGYRRIGMSTCQGGLDLEKSVAHPCPGHETDFKRKHGGLGWFSILLIIVVPMIMASVTGFIVWDHYSKKYGQIRLGDEDRNGTQTVIMKYAVVGIAGVIAVASVIPGVIRKIHQRIQEQFFGAPRMRFSQAYVPVDVDDDDEDSLLNDDDDDIEDAEEIDDGDLHRDDA